MRNAVKSHWDDILGLLKTEYGIGEVSYKTWFTPLVIHSESDDTVTLLINDPDIGINVDWFKRKYTGYIANAISTIMDKKYNIDIIPLDKVEEFDKKQSKISTLNHADATNLNPRYTFDTFVVGSNNKLAHAAALAVAESPAEYYNPFFIYGGVGLGKTHLMHSIAHYILEHNPNVKVLYVTSESFTNELITSIKEGNEKTTAFREKYRNIDVLLIDDIQFIIGKESTQVEFFHTFNTLYENKKQIVISSDKHPKEFTTLEDRLKSRFEMGLCADIQQPDYETRMAILKKKEELDDLSINNSVMEYIATNVKSNIRELEGALTKIVALSKLEKREVDLALAEEFLKDHISPDNEKEITPKAVMQIVADQYGINHNDFESTKKSKNIAYPRQIVMYILREYVNLSFTDIGKILGGRDHTTIMHGVEKVESDLREEKQRGRSELTNKIDIIKKKLNIEV